MVKRPEQATPKEIPSFRGRQLTVEGLPENHIAYNVNTLPPHTRRISQELYEDMKDMIIVRIEDRYDKWRTNMYRPGVILAQRNGDTLSLREDILQLRAPEGSNTFGHEDGRFTIMELDGKAHVVVANVEVDGSKNQEKPSIQTVFYKVENHKSYPWQITELTRVDGKDVMIEQDPTTKDFVRVMRPNSDQQYPGSNPGKIVIDVVHSINDLKKNMKDARLLAYPQGQELRNGETREKEGGNQLLYTPQGWLLLEHRAHIPHLTIATGDSIEDYEKNFVWYSSFAAFIPNLYDMTEDGKIKVTKLEKIADVTMFDTNGLKPKEERLGGVLFTGGYQNGDILCGLFDAYTVAISAPQWIRDAVDGVSEITKKVA